MEILRSIKQYATARDKKFLVIGGHALNAHGISRTTGDLDLMVARVDAEFWEQLLETFKYTIFQRTSSFVQSKAPSISEWSIDLMLVDESTLSKALAEAMQYDHGGAVVPTASVAHLIAMKLHSLKANQPYRAHKDLGDLFQLLKIKALEVTSEEFKQICLKYATMETYERIIRSSK
jgi:hypothetical protein